MDSSQLLLSWKSWFVHLLATAQMSSVSGPFSHAAGTGTLQHRAGPLFLRYRRVDLLLGPDLCCFCAGWCRDHLDPGLGACPAATSPSSTKTSYGTARHTLARQRELPPSRNTAPATTQEWANSGSTSIQQLDTRRLHAARGRRLNVSFPVAAADRSVAGADLAQRADGGAAPPPDQGAQGAGVLVADRRGDGVDRLAGRAEQEGRLIQPDLVEEVDR